MSREFYELEKHRRANQDIEDHTKAFPAILADQRPGVCVLLGRFKVCLSRDGAYRLASAIADSLQEGNKQ